MVFGTEETVAAEALLARDLDDNVLDVRAREPCHLARLRQV
jgi:hypothetical protein